METRDPKDYTHLIKATSFSAKQLKAHFKLYEGYVKKLNEIQKNLRSADRSKANYSFSEYSELRRREPVAYNGTVLHELYFDALGRKNSTTVHPRVKQKIVEAYGSWPNWVSDMTAAGSSCHGWVLMVFDPGEKKLRTNLIQSEHHVGLFANTPILLALDVWEHAYTIQFGINKSDYLKAFFDSINWDAIYRRFSELPA